MTRTCRDCATAFVVSADEQAALTRIAELAGWLQVGIPSRCAPCRKAHREGPHVVPWDVTVQWYERDCVDCGAVFQIGPRDVEYLRDRRMPWPRRCRPCRSARRPREARA